MLNKFSIFSRRLFWMTTLGFALSTGAFTTEPGVYSTIEADPNDFISGLRVQIAHGPDDTQHLSFLGLVPQVCAEHLRIELDTPSDSNNNVYAIRFQAAELAGRTLAEDCNPNAVHACTRETCASLTDPVIFAQLGLQRVSRTSLDVDAPVKIQRDHREFAQDDPRSVTFSDITRTNGGPINFQTDETLARQEAASALAQRSEEIESACEIAESGRTADERREAVALLNELLGEDSSDENRNFFEELTHGANLLEVEALAHESEDAEDLERLNALIDSAKDLAREHRDLRNDVVRLLVEKIALRASQLAESSDNTIQKMASLEIAERALREARRLNPTNQNIRYAETVARIARFRTAAESGDDRFYSDRLRRESYQTQNDLIRWAAGSSDPMVQSLARDFQQTMGPRSIPVTRETQFGQMSYNTYGNALDQTFIEHNVAAEISSYQQQRMQQVAPGVSGPQISVDSVVQQLGR